MRYLVSPKFPPAPATSDEVKIMLGLSPKQKLPPDGLARRTIAGIEVYVLPLAPKTSRFRRMEHRVMAVCPGCKAHVSVGRLKQHARGHA